ncbi:segregation/condensation protein A, partial [archaeon]|nr:segregation/condensation protein A [archaeon]
GLFKTKDEVYFSHLLKSNSKEDKVLTLLPLLHLDTQAKIELEQNTPFEDIKVNLNS